jgi:dynein heavy chain
VRELFKVGLPASGSAFDYFFDMKTKERLFKPWQEKVTNFSYIKDTPFFELMVETEMTFKYSWCLELLLEGGKSAFYTGNSGVGKSVIVQSSLNKLAGKNTNPIYLNFSAQTDSKRTQQNIQEKLEKISRKVLGAPAGKKNVIFVDDINMPKKEFFGASPPIELLRIFIDRKGLYERADWEWKEVKDTTLIASAAPPVGGREILTPRFSTHFNMFCLPEASTGLLSTIFCAITNGYLKAFNFNETIQSLGVALVESTVEIYQNIRQEKRPTPAKFHYSFNLRDVSKVI